MLVSEEGEEEIILTKEIEQHGDGVSDGGVVHQGNVTRSLAEVTCQG
jgi:hypothetical protein